MSENKKENIDTESKHVAPDCECNDQDCACDNSECKADGAEEKSAEQLLEEKLEKAEKELADMKDQYLRKAAEFENYRKRTLKEKGELATYGAENAVKAILPVLDDFERAMADKSDDVKSVRDGMQLIFNKFVKALKGLGVEKIDTADKDFDVDFHEAIAMVPGMGDDKKGKVIDCVQTGYKLNDKVIRHAKVAVGQ
ncbi:MAG: nucleotide exchange factor GrpE [Prevotella sp.]|nr:nucleotide exchange factor GrpE [Prevotella sp.]MDY5685655.1 nucleotide exchange factor GrpE [Prevotella sp.]